MVKTYVPNKDTVERNWVLIDLDGLVLGRAASAIAFVISGKHKPDYAPHVDNGDFVISINADKVKVTGNKVKDKMYYRHSGWPGALKERSFGDMMERDSRKVIQLAVKNMLPKNKLGRALIKKLKVHANAGPSHQFKAQAPGEFPAHVLNRMKRGDK